MVASRSVHCGHERPVVQSLERGRAPRMDLQLDVRQLFVADEGQFDLGVGQEEQVLEGTVESAPAAGGRPGLLDPKSRFGERGPVDPLHGDRSQPIIAAVQARRSTSRARGETRNGIAPDRPRPSCRRGSCRRRSAHGFAPLRAARVCRACAGSRAAHRGRRPSSRPPPDSISGRSVRTSIRNRSSRGATSRPRASSPITVR